MVGIQKGRAKPIVFVHVDDLKLCPSPQDVSWNSGVEVHVQFYPMEVGIC